MKPVLFDTFCKAGGTTKGYQRAGFYVVGVDIEPQPHYCGDGFVQMDALEVLRVLIASGYIEDNHGRRWYLKDFDAIHASPPCQAYSIYTPHKYRGNHPDLIAPVRELLQATGKPFVIENVENARRLLVTPVMLCGSMFGLRVWRHRYFEMPFAPLILTPTCDHSFAPVCVTGSPRRNGDRTEPTTQARRDAMDTQWMNRKEMDEAIPPAFTKFIGAQLLAYLSRTPAPLGAGVAAESE